jgi:hypothetical protein
LRKIKKYDSDPKKCNRYLRACTLLNKETENFQELEITKPTEVTRVKLKKKNIINILEFPFLVNIKKIIFKGL